MFWNFIEFNSICSVGVILIYPLLIELINLAFWLPDPEKGRLPVPENGL
jgi:hypothetical protein